MLKLANFYSESPGVIAEQQSTWTNEQYMEDIIGNPNAYTKAYFNLFLLYMTIIIVLKPDNGFKIPRTFILDANS